MHCKRFFALIVLMLMLSAVLCGCSGGFLSAQELMHPPKFGVEDEELQAIFEESLGKKVVLKQPSAGEYRSAYVKYDFDDNGKDEAIVFYALAQEKSSIKMALFRKENDKWDFVGKYEGMGSAVYSIEFCDLNKDGLTEVIICWNLLDSNAKVFSVYTAISKGTGVLKNLCSETYSIMDVQDLNQDGLQEIIYAAIDNSNQKIKVAHGTILSMDENSNSIKSLGEFKLDGNVVGYAGFYYNFNSDNSTQILLDAYKGENGMLTEMIVLDKDNNISTPLFNPLAQTTAISLRSGQIPCRDFNGDGRMDVPIQFAHTSSNTITDESFSPFYLTQWVSFSNDGTPSVLESNLLYFTAQMYTVLPDEIAEGCIFDYYTKTNQYRVFERTSDGKGQELLTINLISSAETSEPNQQYTISYNLTAYGEEKKLDISFINHLIYTSKTVS